MISTIGGLFNLNHFDQGTRANDVIVIRHKDGTLHSSPFNVRFGRAKIWNSLNKVVQVEVNGKLTTAVMKIGKGGEAYWLQPTYGPFGAHHKPAEADASGHLPDSRPSTHAPAAAKEAQATHGVAGKQPHVTFSKDTLGVPATPHPHSPLKDEAGDFVSPRQVHFASSASSSVNPQQRPSPTPSAEGYLSPTAQTPSHTNPLRMHPPPQRQGVEEAASHPSAASDTPADTVPLLEERDDGSIGVPRGAIHSAKDAEQAKLALRAVAAAEKSRKRLSRLITEDPFLLEAARQEGEADDVIRDAVQAEEEEARQMHTDAGEALRAETGAAEGGATPQEAKPDTDAVLQSIREVRHGAQPVDTQEGCAGPPEEREAAAHATVVAEGSKPTTATAAKAAAPEKVSRMSSTSSDELREGGDDDDYFLDPIDADDFDDQDLGVSSGMAAQVLRNCSFSSSVTSGVSLNDIPSLMANADEDAAQSTAAEATTPRKQAATSINTSVDNVTSATTGVGANDSQRDASHHRSVGTGVDGSFQADVPQSQSVSRGPDTAQHAVSAETKSELDFLDEYDRMNDLGPESDDEIGEHVPADPRATHAGPPQALPLNDPSGSATNYFTRTLLPTEEDLRKLNLVEGCNTVRYLARKSGGGVVSVSCNIFLWDALDRLVVSDIDGTITKSDLWGHFYQALGKGADWTHPGICSLYSKIVANGYKMVYLTARSVAQIDQTKHYLWTLEQEGVKLPLGPVLTAPQRFFTALTQEVSKQSHVFKIACLTGVKAAFPPHSRPFFAGFGNRYNDLISYDAVGVPTHKIFIIDPTSVLHVCQVKQTYRNLAHLVELTFPRIHKRHYHRAHHAPSQSNDNGASNHARPHDGRSPVPKADVHATAWSGLQPDTRDSLVASANGIYGFNPNYSAAAKAPEGLQGRKGSGRGVSVRTGSGGSANSSFFSTDSDSSGPLRAAPPGSCGGSHDADGDADAARGPVPSHSAMFNMSGNDLRSSLRITGEEERRRLLATGAATASSSTPPTLTTGGPLQAPSMPNKAVTGGATVPNAQSTGTSGTGTVSRMSAGDAGTALATAASRSSSTSYQGPPAKEVTSFYGGYAHMDDDVMPDPEFSSYNFWRCDPRDLISSATAARAATSVPTSAATKAAAPATVAAGAAPAATATAIASTGSTAKAGTSASGSHTAPAATAAASALRTPAISEKKEPPPSNPASATPSQAAATKPRSESVQGGVAAATPPSSAPPASGNTAAAAAAPAKRGFFSFGFARGVGSGAKSADPAPTRTEQRNPYSHPDYLVYTMPLPPASPPTTSGDRKHASSGEPFTAASTPPLARSTDDKTGLSALTASSTIATEGADDAPDREKGKRGCADVSVTLPVETPHVD